VGSITVGFSRPKAWFSPFSWFIRLGYWSPFSHAYIEFDLDGLDRRVVLQASGFSINLISEDSFDAKEIVFREFELPITEPNLLKLKQFGIDQLGKPYSLKGIVGMILVRAAKLIGKKIESPWAYDGSSDFCSELVAQILKTYGGVAVGLDPADMSPKDVYDLLLNLKP
jgi:hypothetical protein